MTTPAKTVADDGSFRPSPGHHGNPFAHADAYPNATLLRLIKYGLEPMTVKETDHYKALREFFDDPEGLVEAAIGEGDIV